MPRSELGCGSTTRRRDITVPTRSRRGDETASAVMRAVLDHGPVARSTVARLTGLSAATVSVVAGQLLGAGVLREVPEAAGPPGVGRPHVPVDVETATVAVLAAQIAVGHATIALLDLRGRVLDDLRVPYDAARLTPAEVLGQVALGADRLLARTTDRDVLGLGVVSDGWVDGRTGTIVDHPVLGWHDVAVGELLAAATGLPVWLDGRPRALVLAERLFGAVTDRARESVVSLVVGDVVEVAFAVGNTIHRGPRSAGGTIAHLPVAGSSDACRCGRTGCVQAAVSETALLRRARHEGLTGVPDLQTLVDIAAMGDLHALELLLDRARVVGGAAAMLLDLFNPEVLVVVEAGVAQVPACLAALHAEIGARSSLAAERGPEHCVLPTSFPGRSPTMAGAAVALDQIYATPLDILRRLSRAS